jgi:hypothetical protein
MSQSFSVKDVLISRAEFQFPGNEGLSFPSIAALNKTLMRQQFASSLTEIVLKTPNLYMLFVQIENDKKIFYSAAYCGNRSFTLRCPISG